MNSLSDNDMSKLLDALQADYPVLHQLIGDDYFTVLACRYFQCHPPVKNTMMRLDEHLVDFLKTERPYAHVPSLADLVMFETAMRQATVVADRNVMTLARWDSLDAETRAAAAFNLHPALSILKLAWNAPQIWDAVSSGKEVPEPEPTVAYWLVYPGEWRSATPLEVAALESVYHGLTLAELREELCNLVDDVETVPAITETFLRSWIAQGFLLPTFLFPKIR